MTFCHSCIVWWFQKTWGFQKTKKIKKNQKKQQQKKKQFSRGLCTWGFCRKSFDILFFFGIFLFFGIPRFFGTTKFPNLWKIVFFGISEYSKHLVLSEMSLSVAKVTEKHLQIIVSIWCKISRKNICKSMENRTLRDTRSVKKLVCEEHCWLHLVSCISGQSSVQGDKAPLHSGRFDATDHPAEFEPFFNWDCALLLLLLLLLLASCFFFGFRTLKVVPWTSFRTPVRTGDADFVAWPSRHRNELGNAPNARTLHWTRPRRASEGARERIAESVRRAQPMKSK